MESSANKNYENCTKSDFNIVSKVIHLKHVSYKVLVQIFLGLNMMCLLEKI